MNELRYYQRDAIKAVLDALQTNPNVNPCIEIPTGGGKTPIIATLCGVFANAGARVLVVAHRKELLEQTVAKLSAWTNGVSYSVVSAGLGSKRFDGQIVVAGIQSVYRCFDELLTYGKIDFIIVDEAHLIPSTDENAEGMYQTLINGLRAYNPRLRVVGLTATPYRLSSGAVCGNDKILNEITYRVGVNELIANGYLSPLTTKAPPIDVEQTKFSVKRGEFDAAEVDAAYNTERVIYDACQTIARLTKNRQSVLIFCCSVAHCKAVASTLARLTNDEVQFVIDKTSAQDRAAYLRRFRRDTNGDLFASEEPLKYLCNVDVLTTGFDAPNVDCVCLLRPTASPGLYYQMCGRGLRICEGKRDCLILDFAKNLSYHGPIDKLEAPVSKAHSKGSKGATEPKTKTCPICFEVVDIKARLCPNCNNKLVCDDFSCPQCGASNDNSANYCAACGFQFRSIANHEGDYDNVNTVLSSGAQTPEITERVARVQYYQHKSKRSGKNTLRVDYDVPSGVKTEYICFDHEGYARQKACKWWAERSAIEPTPISVAQAFEIIETVGVNEPSEITYRPKKPGEFAERIIDSAPKERRCYYCNYPRTDNKLALRCECGCQSFLYENPKRDYYFIRCAICGAVVVELSKDSCPNQLDFDRDLKYITDAGIAFYTGENGALERNRQQSDDYFFATNNEDDIPF